MVDGGDDGACLSAYVRVCPRTCVRACVRAWTFGGLWRWWIVAVVVVFRVYARV